MFSSSKIASNLDGVNKVLSADHEDLKDSIAEEVSLVVRDIAISGSYTHVLAPSSNHGDLPVYLSILWFSNVHIRHAYYFIFY